MLDPSLDPKSAAIAFASASLTKLPAHVWTITLFSKPSIRTSLSEGIFACLPWRESVELTLSLSASSNPSSACPASPSVRLILPTSDATSIWTGIMSPSQPGIALRLVGAASTSKWIGSPDQLKNLLDSHPALLHQHADNLVSQNIKRLLVNNRSFEPSLFRALD